MSNFKLGLVFLLTVLSFIFLPELFYLICPKLMENSIFTAIISSAIVVAPSVLMLCLNRKKQDWKELLPFHKIKISTFFKIMLFTVAVSPVATFLNVLSQLFVENAVADVMTDMISLPFVLVFFLIAVYAPLSEEIVFRGVLYQGFRQNSGAWRAMWYIGILFGIMHMNLNQAMYAFAVGVIMVLLVEATGSLWSSVLYHIFFNGTSVVMLYVLKWLSPETLAETTAETELVETKIVMIVMVFFYGIMAIGGAVLGSLILYWIAKGEGRVEYIKGLWTSRKEKKGRIMTIPLAIGMLLCVGMMIFRIVIESQA